MSTFPGFDSDGNLLRRFLVSFFIIACYRLGTYVPLPGVDVSAMQSMVDRASGGILGIFNVFSGGALGRMTIFSLSVMPYVVASIVIQLISVAFKSIGDLKSEGDMGRRKLNLYSRLATLLFCLLQGGVMIASLESADYGLGLPVVYEAGFQFRLVAIITLVGGTMLLLWLGDQISFYGIGNGISIIIFAGIVTEFPSSLLSTVYTGGISDGFSSLLIFISCAVLFFIVVLFERSYRKIAVFYPRKQVGNKMYGGGTSHIPIKTNVSGVMPVIFANSLMLFPVTLADFAGSSAWAQVFQHYLAPGGVIYMLLYASLVVFFCFFYSSFVFNCTEISSSLKKNGGFIPGKRPGTNTAEYLAQVVASLTVIGSSYLALICIVPEFLRAVYMVPFGLGGASFLIMVSVVMDVFGQIQSYVFSGNYGAMMNRVALCHLQQKH